MNEEGHAQHNAMHRRERTKAARLHTSRHKQGSQVSSLKSNSAREKGEGEPEDGMQNSKSTARRTH